MSSDPKARRHFLHHAADRRGVSDIGRDRHGSNAQRFDVGGGRPRPLGLVVVVDRHVGAGARQFESDLPADPAAAAGDDRDAAGQR